MFCWLNKILTFISSKCVLILLIITISLQIYFYSLAPISPEDDTQIENGNILLWWTPFVSEPGRLITCGDVRCLLTSNRDFKKSANLKALLFYGSLFNESDLPVNRKHELWGLLHEESPRNTPLLSHEPILSLFNYTSTISRFSDLPLTLNHLPSLQNLTSNKYFVSFEEKCNLESKYAPVVYIQSDCETPNNRDSYVYELMKYIEIDSYGQCLNNKQLPLSLSNSLETMMSEELIQLISKYKFAIAFENAVCDDYITEKLWRPLIAGTIPIYSGSPSVKDWLPNDNSAIFPQEFNSTNELVEFLKYLAKNSSAYNSYRKHKIEQKIDNSFLIKNFRLYEWSTSDDSESIIEEFECLLCTNSFNNNSHVANKNHYNCPRPVSMIDGRYNVSNWWHKDFLVSKCEAQALRKYLEQNNTFVFNYDYYNDKDCTLG